MKRFIVVLVSLSLLISFVVFPASAEAGDPFLNILDYDTADEEYGQYLEVQGTTTASFDIPTAEILTFAEIVFSYSGRAIEKVEVGYGNNFYELTGEQIRSQEYRYYGQIPSLAYDPIELRISNTGSGTSWITIYSFKAYRKDFSVFATRGGLWASPSEESEILYKEADGDYVTTYLHSDDLQELDYYPFSGYLYLSDWRKYDRVDVLISAKTTTIDSIHTYLQDMEVPFTVSYLNGTAPGFNSAIGGEMVSIGGQTVYVPEKSGVFTNRLINISVDLSTLDRSWTGSVMVRLDGLFANNYLNTITLRHVTGYVDMHTVEADIVWYQRLFQSLKTGFSNLASTITTWGTTLSENILDGFEELNYDLNMFRLDFSEKINQLIDGSDRGQSVSNQFNESVDDQSDQFQEMTDVMTSVNQPDIESVDMSVDDMLDPAVITLATTGISSVLSNEIILRMLLMAMTFALMGFILYGKK